MSQFTPPPRRSNTGKIVLIVLAVLGVLCAGGVTLTVAGVGGAAKVIQEEQTSSLADVKINSCTKTVISTVEVGYTITNSSSAKRSYMIAVDIVSKGVKPEVRLGSATGFENDVPAGGIAKGKAIGTVDGDGLFACRLVSA